MVLQKCLIWPKSRTLFYITESFLRKFPTLFIFEELKTYCVECQETLTVGNAKAKYLLSKPISDVLAMSYSKGNYEGFCLLKRIFQLFEMILIRIYISTLIYKIEFWQGKVLLLGTLCAHTVANVLCQPRTFSELSRLHLPFYESTEVYNSSYTFRNRTGTPCVWRHKLFLTKMASNLAAN